MTATLTSTDVQSDRCPKCGAPLAGNIVRITRPRYEALMAAADAIHQSCIDGSWRRLYAALAALPAPPSEDKP